MVPSNAVAAAAAVAVADSDCIAHIAVVAAVLRMTSCMVCFRSREVLSVYRTGSWNDVGM